MRKVYTFKQLIKMLSGAKTADEVLLVAGDADFSFQHSKTFNDLEIINRLTEHLVNGLKEV